MTFSFNHTAAVNHTFNFSDDSNSTSVFIRPNPKQILAWTIVTLFICCIGCISNVLVLYVTWPRYGDKSGVNLLIFHYIFANLLMCAVQTPIRCFMVVSTAYTGSMAPVSICGIIQTMNSVNWMAVYWADAGLSANRVVALFFPHSYQSYSTTRKNNLQIVSIWLVAMAMTLPANFGIGGVMVTLPIGHCAYRTSRSIFGVFTAMYAALPYLIAGVASVMILVKCRIMSQAMITMKAQDESVARVRHRIVVAKMLVMVYVWELVCNVPGLVIANMFGRIFDRDPMANLWMQTASTGQFAFSACIILMTNSKYRDRLGCTDKRISPLENSFSNNGLSTRRRSTLVVKMATLSRLNSISKIVSEYPRDA